MNDTPARYSLLDLRIDLDLRRVERAGEPLDVGGLSFDFLACLIARGVAVVSFDELMNAVWAPAIVNEETVTQRVKLLRQALRDTGRNSRYIRSVRGRGYQLCAMPELIEPVASVPTSPAPTSWSARPLLLSAVAMLSLIAAWMIWAGIQRDRTRHEAVPTVAEAELLQRARYYAAIGQNENNERAIALYRQVLERSSGNIAAALGLSFAYGARVCLFNFPPEWAERAEALAREVLRREPRNSLAFVGVGYAQDCRGFIDAAIASYEQALALDPAERQETLASLANLYEVKGRLAEALSANVDLDRRGVKLRYLQIQIARDLELLGFVAAAESRYERSFRLYPDNTFSNIAYPRFLFGQGRSSEAQAALQQALSRDTDHPDLFVLAGELALLRADRDAAVRAFERARAMRPARSLPATLAVIYGTQSPSASWAQERISALEHAIRAGDRWPCNWLEIALLRNLLGEPAAAVAALEKAVEAGFLDQAYLRASPLFRALADERGFSRVVARIERGVAAQRDTVLHEAWAQRGMLLATARP